VHKFYSATEQVIIGETMADDILDLLNEAIARELGASIQFMWQHVIVERMEDHDLKDAFRDNAMDSMKRAMKIGERLFHLGGDPTVKPTPINIGSSLREMIELDLKSVNEVIKIYQKIIELAAQEEDKNTRSMCEVILAEEEEQKHILMCARGRAIKKI
jgi:bacterioferritin